MQARYNARGRARVAPYCFIHFIFLAAAACLLSPLHGQQILSVVSAANNEPLISPNSLATIYGANLAQGAAAAQMNASGALPNALGGTSVSIGGKPAQLLYVSPSQINFLVPSNTPLGSATVSVTSPNSQTAATGTVPVGLTSPGLFTLPCLRPSRGAVLNSVTFSPEPFQATTSQNAVPDKRTRLSFFGTGLRYAGNSSQNTGVTNVATAVTAQATDSLGGVHRLPVEYAGPAPDFAGLDQVNVVVPQDLEGAGLVNVQMQSGNITSNPVSIVMSQSGSAGVNSGQSFNISTVAGSGVAGDSGDGSSALSAALGAPTGVAMDPQHNLYIASAANHLVRKVAPDGVITTAAGTGAAGSNGDGGLATQAQLNTPMSVAADQSGNIYIADAGANKIRRIAPDGTISTFAGTGTAGFSGDGGLAGAAQLSSPSAVAVDPYGSVVIADTGNNRMRKVTSDGVIDTMAGTGNAGLSGDGGAAYSAALNAPDSVAIGSDGTAYVADEGNQRIRRIASDGSISSLMSSTNLVPLTLAGPMRLTVDPNQQLFVSDSQDQNIQAMGSACQLTPVAGTGSAGFTGDGGPAANARINSPASMTTDASGDVYFADSNNNRVRRLYQGTCGSPASISFNPSPAMSGMTVNGLVQLTCPATQPMALALGSSGNGLQLPSTVTIPQGQTSGTFSFQAPSDNTATGFQVTASNPQTSASGTAVIDPAGTAPSALSMTISPASAEAGTPATGVVTLTSPAPSGGATVSLASNSPAARVAGDAVVPQGQTTAEFSVGTSPVTRPTTATISGTAGGATASASLSVMPQGASTISALTISPSSLTSGQTGTGTVTLASPAPEGGGSVNLSSSGPAATVPAAVTVPAGETTATFPVSASSVTSPSSATITASSANSASATVNVNPASSAPTGPSATLASLSVAPSSVTSGQAATGTVTLASPAPAGGVVVGLASNNTAATVPVSVTVPAGQTTATFPVATSAVSTPATATITAASANTEAAMLTVNPASGGQPALISGFSISPSTVSGGQSATATVTLAAPAPSAGASVNLASNSSAATVPASVTIPAGQTTATAPVSTSTVSSSTTAIVTATSANAMPATLTINPSSTACVGNITLSRSEVIGGNSVNGTVGLTQPAPAGGQPVSLSSSSANASVPETVTVPAGQTSTGFTVGTTPVLSTDNPVISATTGACAGANTGLTLLPAGSLPLGL
jgi:trimeric autotransporter adhesin